MDNQDVAYTEKHRVECEGLEDGIGHPRVYLEIKNEQVQCPYCSKIFKLRKICN